MIVPIRSTGCTVVTLYPSSPFAAVKSFANVIGSGEDPLIDSKWWIELWSEKCNGEVRPNACSSDGTFYAKSDVRKHFLKMLFFHITMKPKGSGIIPLVPQTAALH